MPERWLQMVSDYVLITGVGVVCITYVEILPDGILQPVVQIVSYTDLFRFIDGSGRIIFFVCGNTSFVSSLFSRISSIAYLLPLPIHRGCIKSVLPDGRLLLAVLVKFPFVTVSGINFSHVILLKNAYKNNSQWLQIKHIQKLRILIKYH